MSVVTQRIARLERRKPETLKLIRYIAFTSAVTAVLLGAFIKLVKRRLKKPLQVQRSESLQVQLYRVLCRARRYSK